MPHFERLCVCAHATTYRNAAICITPVWNLSSAARRPIRHYHHQSFALVRGHARQMAHGGLHHHHLHVNARRSAVISSFSNAMCRRGAAASTRANMIASSCGAVRARVPSISAAVVNIHNRRRRRRRHVSPHSADRVRFPCGAEHTHSQPITDSVYLGADDGHTFESSGLSVL